MNNRFSCRHLLSVIALSLLFSTLSLAKEEKAEWSDFEKTVEQAKTIDQDDIEIKVDKPVKIAQGKGVVWGKSSRSKPESAANRETKSETTKSEVSADARSADESLSEPKKTTVKRPVANPTVAAGKAVDKAVNKEPKKTSSSDSKTDSTPIDRSGERFLLKSTRKAGTTDLVETLLEVSGDVKQIDHESNTVQEKMEVVAGFRYEERIDRFSASDDSLVSVRQYNLAKAKMKIGSDLKTPELNETMQTIVCKLDKNKVTLFSPKGPLRGEELLLIEDFPGNTLILDRLLPTEEVRIGDTWRVDEKVLSSFLSLDAVTESKVEAVLTAVADSMAMVELVGDVQGVYLGASTSMTIRAKYQFDLEAKRINWLGLLIEEDRSIGHVGPGFDLVARLQVKISPIKEPETLNDDFMDMVAKKPNSKVLGLKYDAVKGPWRFLHGRDWYVFQDNAQTTILRKVHKGELVAQCNIADMGKVDLKTMTTLDKFRKELVKGLGDNFGKVAAASTSENKFGDKIYKVLIDGVVDDLELRWIYHLLTDEMGQQAVVVFVVEAAMLDEFADADDVLLDTFRLGKNEENETEN